MSPSVAVVRGVIDGVPKTVIYLQKWITGRTDVHRMFSGLERHLHVRPPLAFVFKAGSHDIARKPWFADIVITKSRTVIQDESGLRVAAFNQRMWDVKPFGRFINFTARPDLYVDDSIEIKALFHQHQRLFFNERRRTRALPLPFCFGYCHWSDDGTLLLAERLRLAKTPSYYGAFVP